jgi:hypothetical protein
MRNRGTVYASLLLIIVGLYILLVNLADAFLWLGWAQLWPGFVALAAIAFCLPILVWREHRDALAGLAVPGTILLCNALFFFYNSLTGDWDAWAYLWSLEPVALGAGLFSLWLIGPRSSLVLVAAAVAGLVGLLLFSLFGTLFGSSLAATVAPIVLIALGLLLLVRGLTGRPRYRPGFGA